MATAFTFDNMNQDGVQDGPLKPTIFGLSEPTLITRVLLYFFNGGAGAGTTATVELVDTGINATFGPFIPLFSAGQGGAPNVNVEIFPNVIFPPGKYLIRPSNPAFWSWNSRSGEQG